jgi:hypothetical protein
MKEAFIFQIAALLLLGTLRTIMAVTIGMKPIRISKAQKLETINGIYFQPIGSDNFICEDTIPRQCNSTIPVDLSNDSSITIEWVASDSESGERYISLSTLGENSTAKFGKRGR